MPISSNEIPVFLSGILVAIVKGEITSIQHDIEHQMKRAPTDEEWAKMKEEVYRDAFTRVAKCFPEPLRSRLASQESALIASVLGLN